MTPFSDRQYKYRTKLPTMLFAGLFFGTGAVFFAQMARSNDQGLIVNGIVTLSPWGASVFYWVLAALATGFVLMAAVAMIHGSIMYTQRIVLTSKAIIVPRSRWSAKEIAIPYVSIVQVELSETANRSYQFLKIVHWGGKATINSSLLPTKAAFETVRQSLAERIELFATNAGERRESLVWELSQAACPACGERFAPSTAERAVSMAERFVSDVKGLAAECIEEAGLRKDTPVRVDPYYALNCDKCLARWWYGLAPKSFKPRTEADDD